MNHYTIYRVDLNNFTATVWKQLSGTDVDIEREMNKVARFVSKHDHPSAFVYREDKPSTSLIIPVL
jgi:hypothetical protein